MSTAYTKKERKLDVPFCRPRPCEKCPWLAKFKGDADYLHEGRRKGIMMALLSGEAGDFPCHETTTYVEDDEGNGDMVALGDAQFCAGAALVLLRAERDSQSLRIAERLGMLDTDALLERNADLELWTLRECLDEGRPDPDDEEAEEIETCNTVNFGCLAPAGYMVGSEVVRGTESADCECIECGEPVCSECISEDGHCGNCRPTTDDDYDY